MVKEVKKVDKKDTKKVVKKEKNKILSKIGNGIKNFFNRPTPIFIVLIAIILMLLLFIYKNTRSSHIYVGDLQQKDVVVSNVHCFINSDMNYFHASVGKFVGDKKENKKVYNYEIGYYVVDKENNYIPFATRGQKLDAPVEVATIIEESSSWSFGEPTVNPRLFTNEVVKNIENLHFIFKGSTEKDSEKADVYIDHPVELKKITKS